ncbi:hypothetical protein EDB85DRAFT_1895695 [Lactarius pseudohatsudake]|nr:hypothetical protein EDB85DRAFT_1895695 [Lactarius pseudohatsudake]
MSIEEMGAIIALDDMAILPLTCQLHIHELLIFLPMPFLNIPTLFPAWAIPTWSSLTPSFILHTQHATSQTFAAVYSTPNNNLKKSYQQESTKSSQKSLPLNEIHIQEAPFSMKLHPLPSGTNALTNFDYPARIFASGTVSSAHMPWRASPDVHLQICGVMILNPQRPQPNAPVPSRHVCIAFTGPLLTVEEFEDPLATIAMDDVTFLPHHSNQTVEPFALDLLPSY